MTQDTGLFIDGHRVTGTDADVQGVIGPAVEAAQTQPDADSEAQTAPRALFEEMVTAMQNDTIAHRFSNIESLANNLRLRAHVVLAMQRMSIGVLDADYFEVSRGIPANLGTCHNYHHLMQIIDDGNDLRTAQEAKERFVRPLVEMNQYWTHQNNASALSAYSFFITPDADPWHSIAHTHPFRGECAGALQICLMRGFRNSQSRANVERLMRRFGPLRVGPWHQDYQHRHPRHPTPASALLATYDVPIDYGRDRVIGVPGDYFYFRNAGDYPYLAPFGGWRGENCVYLGQDFLGQPHYSGLGLTGKTEYALRMFMANAYVRDCNTRFLQVAAHDKRPDIDFHWVDDLKRRLRFTKRGVLRIPDLDGPEYEGPQPQGYAAPTSDVAAGLDKLALPQIHPQVWSGTVSQQTAMSALGLTEANLMPWPKSSLADNRVGTEIGPWRITFAASETPDAAEVVVWNTDL